MFLSIFFSFNNSLLYCMIQMSINIFESVVLSWLKSLGVPYSVVTAQPDCSTELVKVAGNAVVSGHSTAGL